MNRRIIDVAKIRSYYVTVNEKRAQIIDATLGKIMPQLKRIDGIRYQDSLSGCAIAHLKVLRLALAENPNEPFLILEDDCAVEKKADFDGNGDGVDKSLIVDVPDDAHCVYVGVSTCSASFKTMYWAGQQKVAVSKEDSTCWRVLNMLSTHAILYCSSLYAIDHAFAIAQYLSLRQLQPQYFPAGHDALIAQLQLTYNVYALKKPIFYQSQAVGGFEAETRVTLSSVNVQLVESSADWPKTDTKYKMWSEYC